MSGEGEALGFKAHIEFKVEKYDAAGNLTETIIREDEATPAEAEKLNELLNSLPDQAAE
ncbi:MAG: hypothetical protein MUO35_06570 [Anaerolineales bacterium]|nr:hypothetical protein [Anaerolineales bacterium]